MISRAECGGQSGSGVTRRVTNHTGVVLAMRAFASQHGGGGGVEGDVGLGGAGHVDTGRGSGQVREERFSG